MNHTKIKKHVLIMVLLFIMLFASVSAYKSDPSTPTHQYIANESQYVWSLMPYELKRYLTDSITSSLDTNGYDSGEDIIIASGEEDTDNCPWPGVARSCYYYRHFWEADSPRSGEYSDGLNLPSEFDSNYRRATELWVKNVMPLYVKGDYDQSYYWLGRVAHLLEDAAVPAHMHNDPHPILDSLENYAGTNYSTWHGSAYSGDQYNYENLPNMAGFDWSQVDAKDKQNIELFRLFWYTAQKTQYYASNDEDGNSVYYDLNDQQQSFSTSLWTGDDATIISDQDQVPANVVTITNATIPHAMKAVAGLYRLFDDAVRIDWPTENHDYRRTGFTLLKGDMRSQSDVQKTAFVLVQNVTQEQVLKPIVADIDGNGAMETVNFVQDHLRGAL